MSLTVVEVRRGEWWTDGSATVLAGGSNVQFQSLGSVFTNIFFAWFGLEKVDIVAAFRCRGFWFLNLSVLTVDPYTILGYPNYLSLLIDMGL